MDGRWPALTGPNHHYPASRNTRRSGLFPLGSDSVPEQLTVSWLRAFL